MSSFPNHLDKTEAAIINKVITYAFAQNWLISVNDGEEWALRRSNDRKRIQEETAATDETTFVFRNAEGAKMGFVWFIHGNGDEVLSDHTANDAMDALAKSVDA